LLGLKFALVHGLGMLDKDHPPQADFLPSGQHLLDRGRSIAKGGVAMSVAGNPGHILVQALMEREGQNTLRGQAGDHGQENHHGR